MSSVYRDKARGGWVYQWRDKPGDRPRRKRLPANVQTRREAEAIKSAWDEKLKATRAGSAPKKCKLAVGWDLFLSIGRSSARSSSMEKYLRVSRAMIPWLESHGVAYWHQLTPLLVDSWVVFRKSQGKAPSTIHFEIAQLKSVLKYLWERELISEIPVRSWPTIKKVPKRPERLGAYSIEDIGKLLEFFKGHEFHDILAYGIYTGAREDEIRLARWSDVSLAEGLLTIQCDKTVSNPQTASRTIQIHPELRPILEGLVGDPSGLLFPNFQTHSVNWPTDQMKRACKKLGIPYRTFHGIRRTFITYLLATGTDLRSVMFAAGHRHLATTQKYLDLVAKATDVSGLPFKKKDPPI